MYYIRKQFVWLSASAIIIFARLVTAVHAKWQGVEPRPVQRIYFANHCSHGDFVLLWTVLPPHMRSTTRPVAGADYWLSSRFRKFIGSDVFRAVLIERDSAQRGDGSNPVEQMVAAIDHGDSLIVFPEGTRNTGDLPLLPFKSGLFHLAELRPEVELVPVWISNLNRVLPKGEIVPIPLICSVTFGAPLHVQAGEGKAGFLARAEASLLGLAMQESGERSKPST